MYFQNLSLGFIRKIFLNIFAHFSLNILLKYIFIYKKSVSCYNDFPPEIFVFAFLLRLSNILSQNLTWPNLLKYNDR